MKKYAKLEPPKLKGYASTLEGYKEYVESYHYYRTIVSSFKTQWAREVKQSSEAGKLSKPTMSPLDPNALARKRAKRKRKREKRRAKQLAGHLQEKVKEAKAVSVITASNLKIAKALAAEKQVLGAKADDGWTTVVHKSVQKRLKPTAKKNLFKPGLGYVKQGSSGFKARDTVDRAQSQKVVVPSAPSTSKSAVRVTKKVGFTPKLPNPELVGWKEIVKGAYASFRVEPKYWLSRANLSLSDLGRSELNEIEKELVTCYSRYNELLKGDYGVNTNFEDFMERNFYFKHSWFPKSRRPAEFLKPKSASDDKTS